MKNDKLQRRNGKSNVNKYNENLLQDARLDLETVRNFIHHVTHYNDTLKPY